MKTFEAIIGIINLSSGPRSTYIVSSGGTIFKVGAQCTSKKTMEKYFHQKIFPLNDLLYQ